MNYLKGRFNPLYEMGKIMDSKNLNANEKLLLIDIVWIDFETVENGILVDFPMERIMFLLKCSRGTASKTVKGLKDKGVLEVIRRGQGNPSQYIYKGVNNGE